MDNWIRILSPTGANESTARHDDADVQADANRIGELLESPDGALMLQRQLISGECSAETRQSILAAAARSTNPHIAELFLDFLPEEQRPQDIELNPNHVLGLAGDAERGRQLFLTDARLQCRNCHQVDKQGTPVGPDLNQIGRKYRPDELLTSLLHPSEKMEPEYRPWSVVTMSGQVHTGFLVERAAGERVVLKDVQGKIINVPTDDIEEMIAQDTSLMPADALRSVPPESVADLLAWLSSLK